MNILYKTLCKTFLLKKRKDLEVWILCAKIYVLKSLPCVEPCIKTNGETDQTIKIIQKTPLAEHIMPQEKWFFH